MEAKVLNFASKQEEHGIGLHESMAKKTSRASNFQNHLELRLGISADLSSTPTHNITFLNDQLVDVKRSERPKRSFCEASSCGLVHQCNLVVPQERQYAQPKTNNVTSRIPNSNFPVVGWPPVRSFRRNIISQQASKFDHNLSSESEVKEEKDKVVKDLLKCDDMNMNMNMKMNKCVMFVKVNMEGYAVGRKIDLKAHDGYDSLSIALKKMFHNFLSVNCLNNQKQDEKDEAKSPNYILLYEDNEGDKMLVGDVPWEMFMSSVRRLYITQDPNKVQVSS